jgi:hypothetical protein
MTQLGEALVFYLKYMAEMERLYGIPEQYGGEEPNLTEPGDAAHVREMARGVGAAACEKAADFLELCGKGIVDHFTGLGAAIANKRKRAYVLREWYWWVHVRPPSARGGWFSCAVFVSAPPEIRISLDKDVCGVVVPYIWLKGGRKAADAVSTILSGWSLSRAGEGLVDDNGAVALARIPIKPQPTESFNVESDRLVDEVARTVARIGTKQMKAIAKFVAGLKKSDKD